MSRIAPKTVFACPTRWLLAAGALFVLTSGAPIAAKAQPAESGPATQNVWAKLCFDAPITQSIAESGSLNTPAASHTEQACYTYVDIRDEPTGIRLGSIGVLQVQALNRTLLIALLPLHATMMPEPGYLLFQDGIRIKLTFLPGDTCGVLGCYARAELSESLLERIKAAEAVSFGMGPTISIPLAWRGFPKAFAGAPTASAQDERQRFIRMYLPPALSRFFQ